MEIRWEREHPHTIRVSIFCGISVFYFFLNIRYFRVFVIVLYGIIDFFVGIPIESL